MAGTDTHIIIMNVVMVPSRALRGVGGWRVASGESESEISISRHALGVSSDVKRRFLGTKDVCGN